MERLFRWRSLISPLWEEAWVALSGRRLPAPSNGALTKKCRLLLFPRPAAHVCRLIRHHGTDPQHFLQNTHRFPQLSKMVLREPRLRSVLKQLSGRKLVFSNAPLHYAQAVLKLLLVDDMFEDIFAIEHAHYRPKPQSAGFRSLLRKHRLRAAQCVMVDDSVENLFTAKRLGMRTVWVSDALRAPSYVDVKIRNVLELPRAAGKL